MAGQAPIIPDGDTIERFIARWSASGAAERANKDSFLKELCRVLGVAVRDLVARGGDAWTTRQAAGAFKGAKLKEVEAVLDSLAALGLVTAWEGAAGRVWRGGSGAS